MVSPFYKKKLLLENENIYLQTLGIEDITDEYVNGLNDLEVNRFLVDVRRNIQTHQSVETFVLSNLDDSNSILFGIFLKKNPVSFVGTVHISKINFFHYTASIGICLFSKKNWKKGYAFQSVILIKDYLFNTCGLHHLEAGVFAKNHKSISMFKRAGFFEGYRVSNKYRHVTSFEDVIFFCAINNSFDLRVLKQKAEC